MTQCKHLAMTHLVEGSEYNMLYVLMLRDVYTAVASLTETQSHRHPLSVPSWDHPLV